MIILLFAFSSFEDKQQWVRAVQKTVDAFTTWKLSTQPRQMKPKLMQVKASTFFSGSQYSQKRNIVPNMGSGGSNALFRFF